MDIKFLKFLSNFCLHCVERLILMTPCLKHSEKSITIKLHFTSRIHKLSLIEILTEINYMSDVITKTTIIINTDYYDFPSHKISEYSLQCYSFFHKTQIQF